MYDDEFIKTLKKVKVTEEMCFDSDQFLFEEIPFNKISGKYNDITELFKKKT